MAEESSATGKRRATIDAGAQQTMHVRIVPSIDNPNKSVIFDIVDRELEIGSTIRIGRYSERHSHRNCMSFKSKVVSRCHCEIWTESDGKLYIRDTKSSSGTFLNHVRLSPTGTESKPVQLHDGDIVQLGVDFQGGKEEMYRSVKMKFELNRSRKPRPLSFCLNAFENIKNLTTTTQQLPADQDKHVEECCICLYALAPFQALFVSPCSHTYHYKCIRPLLSSHPGFQCPICRTYSDLEASVATEEEEEEEVKPVTTRAMVDELLDIEPVPVSLQPTAHINDIPTTLNTNNLPITTTSSDNNNILHDVIEEAPANEYNEGVLSNTEEEASEEETPRPTTSKRERRSSQFMEKIKMVFFEKRKSSSSSTTQQPKQRRRNKNRPRPLSYPNLFSSSSPPQNEEIPPLPTRTRINEGPSSSSSHQLSQTLSRQSTSYMHDYQSRLLTIEAMTID